MAGHSHSHSHHHHGHQTAHAHPETVSRAGGALRAAAAITLLFALVEGVGGWWTGSLALLSDAGHMLTDAAALGFGAVAAWMARRPPSGRHSYGLGRAEILAAFANSGVMLVIVGALAYESLIRLRVPAEVNGEVASLIALGGLGINAVVLRRLSPHRHDLNTRAARLHVLGDLLGSGAALASSLVIWLTGWTRVDPIASLAICLLIAASSVRLLRESLHALMEGVPQGMSVEAIGGAMAAVEGVLSVHDLHVWLLSGSRAALSAHIVVGSLAHWDHTLARLQARLHEDFGIDHVTLQPETRTRPLVRR